MQWLSQVLLQHPRCPLLSMGMFILLCLGVLWPLPTQAAERDAEKATEETQLLEVKKISFTGNTQFSSRTLRKQMGSQQRPFFPPWKRGEAYNPPTVQDDLTRIKKYYFDRGFLETAVRLGRVTEDTKGRSVQIEIVIDEGAPTIVHAVHITGTIPPKLQPKKALYEDLPLRPGEAITKDAFDRSQALLLKRLRDASYARADVVPSTEVDPQAHTAVVTFELVPDRRTRFGRVVIEGARKVRERAIRRQLTFAPGAWTSDADVTASADAIYGLGTFQAVTPRLLNPNDFEAPLDVAFQVRERTMHSLQLGFGFSSVERFRAQAEWLHRNLFGEAEQLRLRAKISSIVQSVEARLHLPYFLAPRTTLTHTVYVRNEQEVNTDPIGLSDALFDVRDAQPAYDVLNIGSEVRVTHHFTRTLSGAVGVELSFHDFRHVRLDLLTPDDAEAAIDNLLCVQFVDLQWNTRDNTLNPSRGALLHGTLEHSNTALLSDVSFIKWQLEGRHFQRLWGPIILATRLKFGTIQPYGGSHDVPFNVRFFAGGPGSVRGFALNRLGPLDARDRPIGGKSLVEGSVEVRFPIAGDLGGALFVDFGNVFRQPWTYRLDDLRYAVGPGIRYNTPIGPVRLDVGFLVARRPSESFGRVELSIGQAF